MESATFRILSSGKKNPFLKYVSSYFFVTLAIELHLVHFTGSAFYIWTMLLITVHNLII